MSLGNRFISSGKKQCNYHCPLVNEILEANLEGHVFCSDS